MVRKSKPLSRFRQRIVYDLDNKAVSNLLIMYHLFSEKYQEMKANIQEGYVDSKSDLAEVINHLNPIRKMGKLAKDKSYLAV